MDWYAWIVLIHVLAAFTFVMAHGVSIHVAFRLRGERERERVAALLDLSSYSLAVLYIALLVLLVAGVTAGFVGEHWGRLWIWVSIGILVVLLVSMYVIASPYYNEVRRAAGMKAYGDAKDAPPPEPVPAAELAAKLASSRPMWLGLIGGAGLVAIIGLMMLKPF